MGNVNESRQAGDGLQDTEKLYRFIAENTNDMISRHLPDSTYLYVSPACRTLLGYEPEELIGTKAFDLIHPEDVERVIAISQKVIRSGGTDMGQYRHLKKNGQYIWVETVGKVIKDEATGNVEDIICVVRDITDRKQSELALSESQAHLLALIESTDDFIWSVDSRRYGLISFNHSLRKYFSSKYGLEIRTGMTPDDMLPPKYAIVWHEFYQRALREGSFSTEYLVSAGTNVLLLTFNLLRRNMEVFGISVFGKEITERKQAEEALRFSEERYRSVVENIGIGISVISPSMEILTLNKQMKTWFPHIDVSSRPICYRTFNNPPREEICSYCPTCKTLQDGQVHEAMTETPAEDKTIFFRVISSPVKDHDGKIIAAIEMVEDITERKRTETTLQERIEELERFRNATIQREFRIKELKDRVKELEEKL